MHFSLHTAEICLHNICQQPEHSVSLSFWVLEQHESAALTFCCWHPWLSFALRPQTRREAEGRGKRQTKSSPWCMCSWAISGRINFLEQILPSISLSPLHCLPLARLEHDCFLRTQVNQRLVFFGLLLQFLLFLQKSFTSFKIRLRSFHDNYSRLSW